MWINVWSLSNQDEVWQAFLQALFNEVNRRLPFRKRVDWRNLIHQLMTNSYRLVLGITPVIVGVLLGKENADWHTVFQVLANPLSMGGAVASGAVLSVLALFWMVIKPAVDKGREIVNIDLKQALKFASYSTQISELMALRAKFDSMVKELVGKDGRIVVFIDDLDRCAPDKVAEVLEAVKLFANTSNCVYVIGADEGIVRSSIQTRYKFNHQRAADDYLDKIVQIPFYLPPLERTRVREFIRDYAPDLGELSKTVPEIFSKGLEANPRKVKRALNIFRTLKDLTRERFLSWEIDRPMELELLAKMVVLQDRFPNLYNYLVTNPEFLLKIEEMARRNILSNVWKSEDTEYQGEINRLLSGKDAIDHQVLISKSDLPDLQILLTAGAASFCDSENSEQIADYIYLHSSDQMKNVQYTSRERELLLGSSDPELQLKAVAEIMARAKGVRETEASLRKTYLERLQHVQDAFVKFKTEEIERAPKVAILFESWKSPKEFDMPVNGIEHQPNSSPATIQG